MTDDPDDAWKKLPDDVLKRIVTAAARHARLVSETGQQQLAKKREAAKKARKARNEHRARRKHRR